MPDHSVEHMNDASAGWTTLPLPLCLSDHSFEHMATLLTACWTTGSASLPHLQPVLLQQPTAGGSLSTM